MLVQEGQLPNSTRSIWLVLDDNYQPIEPITAYLRYLDSLEKSPNTVRTYAYNLKLYWEFLQHKQIHWQEVNLEQLADFIHWLRNPQPAGVMSMQPQTSNRTEKTINHALNTVSMFYEFHIRLGEVLGVTTHTYQMQPGRKFKPFLHHISKGKEVKTRLLRIKEPKTFPGCLTTEQVKTLIAGCHRIRDKFLICLMYETGMRIGEVLGLRHEDIRSQGVNEIHVIPRADNINSSRVKSGVRGWFIQFMRSKMKFETTIPISIELAQAIKEQHKYIQQNLDKDFPYLFCARKLGGFGGFIPVSNVMSSMSFVNYIKRLGDKFDICDSTGKRWNFQTHQFRHTVGTRMINNGVPQHIIQRYLGHETPEMTSRYAYIHDSTLRKALDRYLGTKVVDINGEVIQSIAPELDNNSELQWLKKKVLAETLSNGYCGLPAQLTCSKGNACLTCSDFRTTIEYLDQHKQHLERTNQVLEVAQSNGWERQIQVNQDVKNSLEKIITTLEGSANA
jgi:integrase/recombinase XerD